MVYESDFYTTRRPYSSSSSRPYVSSYSVSVKTGPFMPYAAHQRLVKIVHAPVRIYHSHCGTYVPIRIHSRVRPSILAAELNRIRYLTRPSNKSYTERYLSSKDYIDFDDETREIRAKTDNLLRRVHVFVPRPSLSDYDETSPERLRSDDYVRRIINSKNTRKEIESLPWYQTPEKRDIGEGHLACVRYAGGRPQPKRRSYYTVNDLVPGDVKTDVKLMSYYSKNRKAAEDASPPDVHQSEPIKRTQDAPAPSVKWADEIGRKREAPKKEATPPRREVPESETDEVDRAKVEEATEPKLTAITVHTEQQQQKKPKLNNEDNEAQEDLEVEYDENGVKKQPDDETIKRVQEYLEKKAAEKKLEEERRAWEAAERRRIADEKEIARLAEIKLEMDKRRAEIIEQERIEAEKQELIARAEAARHEAERLIEDEKLFNEAIQQAIADEQERIAEEEKELAKRKQDEEEEKVAELLAKSNNGIVDELAVDDHLEEHSISHDLSDQDNEALPYEVDHDDDTQVEEDIHEELDEIENPFVDDEGSAAPVEVEESVPQEPQVKVSNRGAGGEQGFDWSEFDSEPEVEAACAESTPAVAAEEEVIVADNQHEDIQAVDDAGSQVGIDEAQIEESQVTEEAQVTEETEETHETEENETQDVVEQADEEATEETQVAEVEEEVQETQEATEVEVAEVTDEAQIEESKSETRSVHDATEENEAEVNEEEEEEE